MRFDSKAGSSPARGAKGRARRRAAVIFGGATIFIVALVGSRVRTVGAVESELPPDVHGTWVTDAPSHGDRTLTFTAESLVLGRGTDGAVEYRVTGIVPLPVERGRAFRIEYSGAGEGPSHLEILLAPDGTLRLAHPSDVVWSRS